MTEIDIIKAIAKNNPSYVQQKAMHPVGIIFHSTGCNNPYLRRYVNCPSKLGENRYGNHWDTASTQVSVHGFIGLDKDDRVQVAQILPYDISCWGCGGGTKGSYNYNPVGHIQFEVCEDDLESKEYFTKVYDKAIEYCAYLCKKFNLSASSICSHKEAHSRGYASAHGDPEHWLKKYGKTMDMFRDSVQARLRDSAVKPIEQNKADVASDSQVNSSSVVDYTVTVSVSNGVNLRSGAGTTYKIKCAVPQGTTLKINRQTAGGDYTWGYTEYNRITGWVALNHIEKYCK